MVFFPYFVLIFRLAERLSDGTVLEISLGHPGVFMDRSRGSIRKTEIWPVINTSNAFQTRLKTNISIAYVQPHCLTNAWHGA